MTARRPRCHRVDAADHARPDRNLRLAVPRLATPSTPQAARSLARVLRGGFATWSRTLRSTACRNSTFAAWAERTPPDFDLAVKISRYLTHILRLRDPAEPVDDSWIVPSPRRKLGPVLLQLPPSLEAEPERLDDVLRRLTPHVRVAVEFRHRSWFTDTTRDLLERRGAALCLTDRRRPTSPLWRTADWTYLRFHEGRARPRPCYGRTALRSWAERLARGWGDDVDAWVYFNNDHRACAPRDAAVFARVCERAGLSATRTPRPSTIGPRR